jgi:hypothetical protein
LESTDTLLMDAIIIYSPASWLDFRAGQMKMPFSAERLESYLINPFVERSLAANLELRRSRGVAMALHPGQGGVHLDLGWFNGENMAKPNTDDHFEGVARGTVRLEKLLPSFPGSFSLAGSAARGRRQPDSAPTTLTTSFTGKTQNELNFFSPINVNGYRTRYEADLSWTYKPLWIAAEWITSEEEREGVAVDLDTDGDGVKEWTATRRHLKPLKEQGWKASVVYVLTGEAYKPRLVPNHKWGALELCLRYSMVSFDSQEDKILDGNTLGREVSAASTALGRRSVDEAVRSADAELNWFLKPGFWIGLDTTWQWFDHSAPYGPDHPDDHDDINYRARVGMAF